MRAHRRLPVWAAFGLMAWSLLPGAYAQGRALPSYALAVVEGDTLRADRFEQTYADLLVATGRNDTPRLRRVHLDNLIDEMLLAHEGIRRGRAVGAAYQAHLYQAENEALAARLFEIDVLDALPAPTDAELRQAFARAHERTVLRHVVYRTEGEAVAAQARLEAGATLLALAQERFGTAPDDTLAGYLGAAAPDELDDAIAEAVSGRMPGEVVGPVRSRYGWHLVEVLDVWRNPVLAEHAYQQGRPALASRFKARRRRLEGDRYVRAFMADRDVQLAPEAARALAALVQDAPGAADEPIALVLAEQPADDLLGPETVLATYTDARQQQHIFTLADYLRWLPALPAAEARGRIGASIGRALRNEAMAQSARRRGLDADPAVERAVREARRAFVAARVRDDLRAHPTETASDTLVARAAARFGLAGKAGVEATFWAVPAASYAEARALRDTFAADPEAAVGYDGYVAFTNALLDAGAEWESLVARAPVGQTSIVGRADGSWRVVHVASRTPVARDVADVTERLRDALAPLATEAALLARLRARARIEHNPGALTALLTF